MTHPKEITVPLAHPLDGLKVARKTRKGPDERITMLVDYLTEKVGDLDGSAQQNRYACASLIRRAEKADPEGDAVESIKRLIDIATDGKNWHARNVTGFRYLLNNARRIANEHRARRQTGDAAFADKMARAAAGLVGEQ